VKDFLTISTSVGSLFMMQDIHRLPAPLLILFCVFLILPFWSLTFVELPWETFARGDALGAGVVFFAYFLGPVLILVTTALSSITFLPIFVVECLTLILHTIFNFQNQTVEFQFLRLVLLGAMAASGILVFNRDTLYPFMSKSTRLWRRSKRIATNVKMYLAVGDQRHSVMMQDISLTGIGLIGSSPEVLAALKEAGKNGSLVFSIQQGGLERILEGKLTWSTGCGDTRQFGVKVADDNVMAMVIGGLKLNSGASKFSQFVVKNWARTGFRRSILSVWGLTLAGSFGVPACGVDSDSKHNRSHPQNETENLPETMTYKINHKMTIDFDNGWLEIPFDDPGNNTLGLKIDCDGMLLDNTSGNQVNILEDTTCPVVVMSVYLEGDVYFPMDDGEPFIFYLKSSGNSAEIHSDGMPQTYYLKGLSLQFQNTVSINIGRDGIAITRSSSTSSVATTPNSITLEQISPKEEFAGSNDDQCTPCERCSCEEIDSGSCNEIWDSEGKGYWVQKTGESEACLSDDPTSTCSEIALKFCCMCSDMTSTNCRLVVGCSKHGFSIEADKNKCVRIKSYPPLSGPPSKTPLPNGSSGGIDSTLCEFFDSEFKCNNDAARHCKWCDDLLGRGCREHCRYAPSPAINSCEDIDNSSMCNEYTDLPCKWSDANICVYNAKRAACSDKFETGATECGNGCCRAGYECNSNQLCDLINLCDSDDSPTNSPCATLYTACALTPPGLIECPPSNCCPGSHSHCVESSTNSGTKVCVDQLPSLGEKATSSPTSIAPLMIGQ
jgi:hypothetical protein